MEKVERHLAELKESEAKEAPLWRTVTERVGVKCVKNKGTFFSPSYHIKLISNDEFGGYLE